MDNQTSTFQQNVAEMERNFFAGKKANELTVGLVLFKSATEYIFVGSACKKFASAMFFGWFAGAHGRRITNENRQYIQQFMAEHWDDEPGTGKHATIDFVREGEIMIVPIDDFIDGMWENLQELSSASSSSVQREAVGWVITQLDCGRLRVAEQVLVPKCSDLPGVREEVVSEWVTHQWLKKAVLLYFRLSDNLVMGGGYTVYYDKVPAKFNGWSQDDFANAGIRVVPPAVVRKGAYIGKGAILMPSYVNIGANVGEGTMVDTWATVGSCAQIGKNCHISGGAGIGGVLEPIQANPTIIGDNCFIGARSEIVEGVIVEDNCVISMGVFIGQSTKIYDRSNGEVLYGRVPAGSVVVAGSLPSADGKYSLYCAVIVKRVDAQTRSKVGINELLRDI